MGRDMVIEAQRGKIERCLALLMGFNGVVSRTTVITNYASMSWTSARKLCDFLEEHGFIEMVSPVSGRDTYIRTRKGGRFITFFKNEMPEFVSETLLDIHRRSENDRLGVLSVKRKRSIEQRKLIILELLKHGDIYNRTKIATYTAIGSDTTRKFVGELERDGLILLYPSEKKTSKGEYGITSKGRAVLLRGEGERQMYDRGAIPLRRKSLRAEKQKLKVLDVLKHGERYTKTRIISYAGLAAHTASRVVAELEKDGLVVLYPTEKKSSKGEYGITVKGKALLEA